MEGWTGGGGTGKECCRRLHRRKPTGSRGDGGTNGVSQRLTGTCVVYCEVAGYRRGCQPRERFVEISVGIKNSRARPQVRSNCWRDPVLQARERQRVANQARLRLARGSAVFCEVQQQPADSTIVLDSSVVKLLGCPPACLRAVVDQSVFSVSR